MAGHLIHIGYPKAGSTFLQAWFEQHPECGYVAGGIGGFHNVYEMARPSNAAIKYYVTSYEGLSTPQQSAGGLNLHYGGAAPDVDDRTHASVAKVCGVLRSLHPDSRILIVTRGFKGLIFSGYSQYVRMGGRLRLREMCGQIAQGIKADALHFYDVDGLLKTYSEAFGSDNLIVMPYELLRDDQARFLSILEDRLGLTHKDITLGPINASLTPAELYWYPMISRTVSAVASRLGQPLFQRTYGWYVGKTMDNHWAQGIKVLQALRPAAKVTDDDFPLELLDLFRGKADRLKELPLYWPYADQYLWTSRC